MSKVVMTNFKHTAAVSTPVGPPPQTTKLRRRFLSSGVVEGRLAISKLSVLYLARTNYEYEYARGNMPKIRRRIACASPIVLSW